MKEPWKHQGESRRDKLNHSLVLENFGVFCSACNKPVIFYGLTQHICGKKHTAKLVIWNDKNKSKQKTIINVNKHMKLNALIGQTLKEDVPSFRLDALYGVCEANMTVKSFGSMVPWIEET